ncbi:MFS transporter [Pelagicoccus mobilis]|uniref:MFS transporter n=1 Tax=Pelagicoccus mobilis TaxID=415221 RepID=A0A934S2L0_9BACT|nr:MFS transporter [Pelagicoccus mobilis]MBK1880035.1 MFS transporter [Pelagicoccus mobilis]
MSTLSETLDEEKELNQHEIAPEDKVPMKEKIGYGLGVVADHHAMVTLAWFALPFFQDTIGLPAKFVGLFMMLAKAWDAINDPLVGGISDNWRSKFGRRRPFILLGAVATGICFPLLWMIPEEASELTQKIYFGATILLFYTFYSVFSVPYESLGSELTPSYKERTNVFAVRAYVQNIFNPGINWYSYLAVAWFGGLLLGIRNFSWFIGLVIIVAGIMPALFCKERYLDIATKQKKVPVLKSLASVLRNGPLMIVIGTMAIYLLAIMSGGQMSYYLNTYYLYNGDQELGLRLGAIDGTFRIPFYILGAYLVQKLTLKYDKHHLMLGSVGMLFLSFFAMYFLITPENPYLFLITRPFLAIAESGFWILIISMKADVCDWDEYVFGRRREGVISATSNWFNKLFMAIALYLGTLILVDLVGYQEDLGAAQPEGVLENMKLAYIALPCTACAIAFLLLLKYPLNHKRLNDIRIELESRRGKVAAEDES